MGGTKEESREREKESTMKYLALIVLIYFGAYILSEIWFYMDWMIIGKKIKELFKRKGTQ